MASLGRRYGLGPADRGVHRSHEEPSTPENSGKLSRRNMRDDFGANIEFFADEFHEWSIDQPLDQTGGGVGHIATIRRAGAGQFKDRHDSSGARRQYHLQAGHSA